MTEIPTRTQTKVLLVEDNPDDAELVLHALRKRRLVNRIDVVTDGEEAVDYLFGRGSHEDRAGEPPPDVILLDLKLPKLDGLEVLREIRSNETTTNVPVVILTSSDQDPDIARAYELRANSYVVKPVDFDSFSEVVAGLGLYWMAINRPPIPSASENGGGSG